MACCQQKYHIHGVEIHLNKELSVAMHTLASFPRSNFPFANKQYVIWCQIQCIHVCGTRRLRACSVFLM